MGSLGLGIGDAQVIFIRTFLLSDKVAECRQSINVSIFLIQRALFVHNTINRINQALFYTFLWTKYSKRNNLGHIRHI